MIGIVADDTTGANDIGLMFSKHRYSVKIVTFSEEMNLQADSDVLIIDTDSRLDSPELSYDKVFKATQALQQLGCTLYFNKTCSVFRGNIGKEFDAMMDALNEHFAVISLAFPKNGRQTKYGVHTMHGKLLEDSEFSKDPVHPMKKSYLVSILQEQTDRHVSLVSIDTVRRGAEFLRKALDEMRKTSTYCIVDAETQDDLTVIAEATRDFPVLCGSSAIGEELPKFWPSRNGRDPLADVDMEDQNGVLVVSGSLTPQTKAQTEYLISQAVPVLVLDSRKVFTSDEKELEIKRMSREAADLLKQGQEVLVMADNREEIVSETKDMGRRLGLDPLTVSKRISAALAEVTLHVVEETQLKRLVVAGGDTSGTVCRKLGIQGNVVLEEIETGLPSGLALGRKMLIVLKSGSFGKKEFLLKAIDHLKVISEKGKALL
ncbi:four-carbon acid sugar kinase family protein [Ammoniphilus sp. YIM 78166]|uniref:four-carbon acid sugar kinase family protein n=1 Tax=Ammoniphilus sp. YIM 78166 TaxID=1644106 RepID=UPI0010705B88|nr:four-carbon acid sugar kinase family protein [Ammoniphilus sp. YIM 78166]